VPAPVSVQKIPLREDNRSPGLLFKPRRARQQVHENRLGSPIVAHNAAHAEPQPQGDRHQLQPLFQSINK
jgi:hypothetical protein